MENLASVQAMRAVIYVRNYGHFDIYICCIFGQRTSKLVYINKLLLLVAVLYTNNLINSDIATAAMDAITKVTP